MRWWTDDRSGSEEVHDPDNDRHAIEITRERIERQGIRNARFNVVYTQIGTD